MAGFLGQSNFLSGTAEESTGDTIALRLGGTRLLAQGTARVGEGVVLSLRPEKILPLGEGMEEDNMVEGRVLSWSYAGTAFHLSVATGDLGVLRVQLPAWRAPLQPAEGLPLRLGWSRTAAVSVHDLSLIHI